MVTVWVSSVGLWTLVGSMAPDLVRYVGAAGSAVLCSKDCSYCLAAVPVLVNEGSEEPCGLVCLALGAYACDASAVTDVCYLGSTLCHGGYVTVVGSSSLGVVSLEPGWSPVEAACERIGGDLGELASVSDGESCGC